MNPRAMTLAAMLMTAPIACNPPASAPTTPPASQQKPEADAALTDTKPTPGAEAPPANDAVIYKDDKGRTLTMADLQDAQELADDRWDQNIAPEAMSSYQAGQLAGRERRFDDAITHFLDASLAAPGWPKPIYGAAWTYLFQGDVEKSLEAYEAVDKIAPRGYIATKAAIDTLKREQDAKLPPASYLRFELQLAKRDKDGRIVFIKEILAESPNFPVAWKELSTLLDDPDESLAAIEKGLTFQPDDDTRGHLLVNKAIHLMRLDRRDEAIEILGKLALDRKSTNATEFMAKVTLMRLHGGTFRQNTPQTP